MTTLTRNASVGTMRYLVYARGLLGPIYGDCHELTDDIADVPHARDQFLKMGGTVTVFQIAPLTSAQVDRMA